MIVLKYLYVMCMCVCIVSSDIFCHLVALRLLSLTFSLPIMKDSEHFSKEQSSVQPLSDSNQKFSFMKAPSSQSIILPCLAFIPNLD